MVYISQKWDSTDFVGRHQLQYLLSRNSPGYTLDAKGKPAACFSKPVASSIAHISPQQGFYWGFPRWYANLGYDW